MASKAPHRLQNDETVEEEKEVGQFNTSEHFNSKGFHLLDSNQSSSFLKEIVIGITLLAVIAFAIALFLMSSSTEPINSYEVYGIKNYMTDVYAC